MELLELIKMLFKTSPKNQDTLILKSMKNYPFKGYKYMMWCGYLIYRGDKIPSISETSMIHETIHLQLAKIKGSWIKYYWSYFIQWMKGNPIVHPSVSAYYTNPYEMEAYANESNSDYIKNYDGSNLKYYTIKNRKSTYRLKGGKASYWKVYLKSIKI